MIIHTNDLHSFFEGVSEKQGSYARLKTIIDDLKQEASDKGMPSIVTDGGDWGEGTSFFYTNDGVDSIKLLEEIGIEIAVVGNHDHMQGGNLLSQQLDRAKVKTKFVSANIVQSREMNLGQHVTSYVDYKFGNIKTRIIGLSTEDKHFKGALLEEGGDIVSPIEIGCAEARKAKAQGIDVVLALTHIGIKEDKKLARNCKHIDAILGGHSHTRLDDPVTRRGTPIIQTGEHTKAVGKLVLDFDHKRKKVKVVEYKLVDADESVHKDTNITKHVSDVKASRNNLFDGKWNKVLGVSKIPLFGKNYKKQKKLFKNNCWAEHMSRLTAEAAGADFGAYLTDFGGITIPMGNITYGGLVDNFPHFKKFGDKGWQIGKVTAPGKTIKKMINLLTLMTKHNGLSIYGAKVKSIRIPGTPISIPTGIRQWLDSLGEVQGNVKLHKIKNDKIYSFAFPTEIFDSMVMIAPKIAESLAPYYKNTGKYYWDTMAEYVQKTSPIKCL